MSNQQSSHTPQNMKIQFEVVPDDGQPANIADTDDVGQSLVDQLRNNGYSVTPASSENDEREKGGPIFDILVQVPQFIHDNKDVLLAVFDSITLTLQCILSGRERLAQKEKIQRTPLKITLQVDGNSITIETANSESAIKLLEHFQNTYPEEAKKVTPKSHVKIKVKVPKKRHRHSH